jgi:hypothetical protein
MLIEKGANIEKKDIDGYTPLICGKTIKKIKNLF